MQAMVAGCIGYLVAGVTVKTAIVAHCGDVWPLCVADDGSWRQKSPDCGPRPVNQPSTLVDQLVRLAASNWPLSPIRICKELRQFGVYPLI